MWLLYTTPQPHEWHYELIEKLVGVPYRSEETAELPEWTYLDEVSIIHGYTCRRAEAEIYSFNWVVWYTTDITLPTGGPWLLHGLPGLVVSAKDTEGYFSFELTGIEESGAPMLYRQRPYVEADRIDVFDMHIERLREQYSLRLRHHTLQHDDLLIFNRLWRVWLF